MFQISLIRKRDVTKADTHETFIKADMDALNLKVKGKSINCLLSLI